MAIAKLTSRHVPSSDRPAPAGRRACEFTYRDSLEILAATERLEIDRQGRMEQLLLRHDTESLRNDLRAGNEEQAYLKADADGWRLEAHRACEKAERASAEMMKRMKELRALQVQLSSVQEESQDTAQVLSEKLTLARELAQLKPELEDLRTRHQQNENLLTEKLQLQRELDLLRAELQTERTSVKNHVNRREKLEAANIRQASEIEDLRVLVKETQREIAQATTYSTKPKDICALEDKLVKMEKEKQAAAKEATKANSEWRAEREVLEEKLENARNKIRTLKEKLKEAQAEALEALSQKVADAPTGQPVARNPRKRSAIQFNAETALGTPGDDANVKRSKRAGSVIGEKSHFSITPFLNRTSNVVSVESADPQPVASIADDSPVPVRELSKQPAVSKCQPLAPASPGKANLKVRPRVPASKSSKMVLASVIEENAGGEQSTEVEAQADGSKVPRKGSQLKLKAMSRELTREASVQPRPKKQRKLCTGRTLFDDEDDQVETAILGVSSKGFASQRAFGAAAGRSLTAFGAANSKRRGLMVVKPDGFMFSPLKKDRKAAAALHAIPAA